MNIRLDGKTAIITGAASGIGHAIAEGMVEAGATVVIADINLEACTSPLPSQLGESRRCRFMSMWPMSSLAATLCVEPSPIMGQLDILVNNAGICPLRSTDEVDQAYFRSAICGQCTRCT